MMNVVYLQADQWRGQAVGYAGNPDVQTPHLDALAAESMRFRCAVANVPVCCPNRANLLTGKMPHEHGVFLNDVRLRDAGDSIAHRLNALGYHTGWIGKWHLNGNGRAAPIAPEHHQGFRTFLARECNHAYWDGFYFNEAEERVDWPGYEPEAQTDDACRFLEQRASDHEPFALFLSWGPPHNPYQTAPDAFRAMYQASSLTLRENVPSGSAAQARGELAGYYAHCSALDGQLKRVLDHLDALGLSDNTCVVFTSDHGDMLGSQGEHRKQRPWDESILVPMLVRLPGVQGCDLYEPFGTVDTADALVTLAQGQHPQWQKRASLIASYAPFGEWTAGAGGKAYRGVRTRRHTYAVTHDGPWLLFDNAEDPFQRCNLVDDRQLRQPLEELLQEELDAVGDAFDRPDELIGRWGYAVDETGTMPYWY